MSCAPGRSNSATRYEKSALPSFQALLAIGASLVTQDIPSSRRYLLGRQKLHFLVAKRLIPVRACLRVRRAVESGCSIFRWCRDVENHGPVWGDVNEAVLQ